MKKPWSDLWEGKPGEGGGGGPHVAQVTCVCVSDI